MKKGLLVVIGGVVFLLSFCLSQADATLIGVRTTYASFYPKISYDGGGLLKYGKTYTGEDNLLVLTADDMRYIVGPGDYDNILGAVKHTVKIYVDTTGNFIGGIPGYDMTEIVTADDGVTIRGHTYSKGDTLLYAEVVEFGWGEKEVDFIFESVGGELVDDGLWPYPPASAGYATLDGTPNWSSDFIIGSVEGKKMPTPESSSLLLLGTGLLGFGAYFRARFGRKK